MSRGSRTVPPQPGIVPTLVSGRPMTVSRASLAMRQWLASATSVPPPAQAPWMAHTTGTLKFASRAKHACPSRETAAAAAASGSCASHLRSAPAMKMRSFALITTTAFTGCAASAASAARRSAKTAGVSTLTRAAGSSNTIQPIWSRSTEWVTVGFMG